MKERASSCFTFTEREHLYDQVSHRRFLAFIAQPDVDIHEVKEDSNSFGEYLFVTVSCRTEQPKNLYTFWGLGFHEYRERWIADSWQWFESQRNLKSLPLLDKESAHAQIKDREAFVRASATPIESSPRAQLYDLIADLTDEDSALSELDDLGWMLLGNPDEANDE